MVTGGSKRMIRRVGIKGWRGGLGRMRGVRGGIGGGKGRGGGRGRRGLS